MRTQGQSKISSCCVCVWFESRELGGRGSPRFPCVTPVVESFPSDLLRAIVSYWVESHLESCQAYHVFPQKSSTADVRLDSICASNWSCFKCEVRVDCKCMEFLVASLCRVKQLRLGQTIRNLTCGDLEIVLVVIGLGVVGLKKTRFVYLPDLFGGRGRRRGGVISCVWSAFD